MLSAGLGDKRALLMCHGRTGTPVGYLNNCVVWECDTCFRKVGSEITREEFLSSNAMLSGAASSRPLELKLGTSEEK